MFWLTQAVKSNTIKFNVIIGGIVTACSGFGVTIDPEIINFLLILGNIILRFLTNKAISEK